MRPPRFDPDRPGRWRTGWYAFVRAVSWHRRKLAVVCAVAAVLTGLTAVAPPRPETVPVLRVDADLPGGQRLGVADVQVDSLPAAVLPRGALTDPAQAIGKTLAGRVPEGQILTGADLVGGRTAATPGRVIAPVRLADGDLAALLTDGDVVDVIGTDDTGGRAQLVASAVRIVAVPASARDPASAAGGGLVLVEVDRTTATALAKAMVAAQLSVIWR